VIRISLSACAQSGRKEASIMAVSGMRYHWGWAYESDWSVQYNFSPSSAVAQCPLSMADGDGLCTGGITQYRTRPHPNGPVHDRKFSWNPNFGFPPSVYDPNMTSVTAELVVGNGQQGVMTLNVWFFS
jgi:hypothetical protein